MFLLNAEMVALRTCLSRRIPRAGAQWKVWVPLTRAHRASRTFLCEHIWTRWWAYRPCTLYFLITPFVVATGKRSFLLLCAHLFYAKPVSANSIYNRYTRGSLKYKFTEKRALLIGIRWKGSRVEAKRIFRNVISTSFDRMSIRV